MGFIQLEGIENVKEKELLPVAEYDFVVTDVKSEEVENNPGAAKIRLRCNAEGMPEEDYQPVFHYISAPGAGDDQDKRQNKLLFLKRFLNMVGIDPAAQGGFSEEDLMGARFHARVDASEYEGREGRNLVVPPLPMDQDQGKKRK